MVTTRMSDRVRIPIEGRCHHMSKSRRAAKVLKRPEPTKFDIYFPCHFVYAEWCGGKSQAQLCDSYGITKEKLHNYLANICKIRENTKVWELLIGNTLAMRCLDIWLAGVTYKAYMEFAGKLCAKEAETIYQVFNGLGLHKLKGGLWG